MYSASEVDNATESCRRDFQKNSYPVHHKYETGVSAASFYITRPLRVNPAPELVRMQGVSVIIDAKLIRASRVCSAAAMCDG